jgi:hypothetical protein
MFARLSERFGWTPDQIAELNSFQIEAYLEWMMENPLPITIAVDPPKEMPRSKRGRRGRR